MHVEVISTEDLGDRSYLVHDGTSAVVVDPQRDVDRVEKMLADLGVQCAMVVETHIHNDYVTGGYDLAMRNGCPYVVNAADDVSFARLAVADGDELTVGAMTIRVMATPGHTDTHLSYVISEGEQTPAVFTGGSLLYGSVGRTDLVDVDRTEELTRAQYHSARRLAAELPDAAPVYPTHGFGSFCSAGSAAGSAQELSARLPPSSYPRRTFAELPGDAVLLDVRRDDEHATDHIPGAAHVPMHHLLDKLDTLPPGQLWVHCASGYRASIAASLLDRAGRDVVFIDDAFDSAVDLGLTTKRNAPHPLSAPPHVPRTTPMIGIDGPTKGTP